MSSAFCFNLDQSRILSSSNGLKKVCASSELPNRPALYPIKENVRKRSPTVRLISTVRGERLQPITNAFWDGMRANKNGWQMLIIFKPTLKN